MIQSCAYCTVVLRFEIRCDNNAINHPRCLRGDLYQEYIMLYWFLFLASVFRLYLLCCVISQVTPRSPVFWPWRQHHGCISTWLDSRQNINSSPTTTKPSSALFAKHVDTDQKSISSLPSRDETSICPLHLPTRRPRHNSRV